MEKQTKTLTALQELTVCQECVQPIQPDEIRIVVPEDCNKDVGMDGIFHRDCGIALEIGEDGFLFEENVDRLFGIITSILVNWDAEHVETVLWPQVRKHYNRMRDAVETKIDQEVS